MSKIALIIIFGLITCGCSNTPDKDDLIKKLVLPDKNYDISLFIDKGGVFEPSFGDIYLDYRNGNYKKIFHFNFNDFAIRMERLDSAVVGFIRIFINTEKTDTVYYKLK